MNQLWNASQVNAAPDLDREEERAEQSPMEVFRRDVLNGLGATPKYLPCKWLYDARGSELFERICETPEYYVTRTEVALLERVCPEVARHVGAHADVLEPGSGAGVKIRTLLDALDRPRTFVPIDISETAVEASADALRKDYPDLRVVPVVADFTHPFELPEEFSQSSAFPKLIFFPGSTISNFAPSEAQEFLSGLRTLLREGEFLFIGVDLIKDRRTLEAAYDDTAGVTAAFNLNLLHRITRELETTLDPAKFRHRAVFDEEHSRVEMHLECVEDHQFEVEGRRFSMQAGQTIHTENSYKYSLSGFTSLAEKAGFSSLERYTDDDRLFSLHLLRSY